MINKTHKTHIYICIYKYIFHYHICSYDYIFLYKKLTLETSPVHKQQQPISPHQTDVLMTVSKLYIVIQYHICSYTYGRDLLTLRKHSKWTQVVPIGSVPINVFPDEPFLQQLAWLCGSDSLFRWWDDKFQIVSCLVSSKSNTPVLGITWHLHQTIKYLEQLMS